MTNSAPEPGRRSRRQLRFDEQSGDGQSPDLRGDMPYVGPRRSGYGNTSPVDPSVIPGSSLPPEFSSVPPETVMPGPRQPSRREQRLGRQEYGRSEAFSSEPAPPTPAPMRQLSRRELREQQREQQPPVFAEPASAFPAQSLPFSEPPSSRSAPSSFPRDALPEPGGPPVRAFAPLRRDSDPVGRPPTAEPDWTPDARVVSPAPGLGIERASRRSPSLPQDAVLPSEPQPPFGSRELPLTDAGNAPLSRRSALSDAPVSYGPDLTALSHSPEPTAISPRRSSLREPELSALPAEPLQRASVLRPPAQAGAVREIGADGQISAPYPTGQYTHVSAEQPPLEQDPTQAMLPAVVPPTRVSAREDLAMERPSWEELTSLSEEDIEEASTPVDISVKPAKAREKSQAKGSSAEPPPRKKWINAIRMIVAIVFFFTAGICIWMFVFEKGSALAHGTVPDDPTTQLLAFSTEYTEVVRDCI